MLVIHNTLKSESTHKKKCNTIANHAIHESITMKESLTGHKRSEDDSADLLTKVVIGWKRKHLVLLVFYDIHDGDTSSVSKTIS